MRTKGTVAELEACHRLAVPRLKDGWTRAEVAALKLFIRHFLSGQTSGREQHVEVGGGNDRQG